MDIFSSNIYEIINDISDLNRQKNVWMGKDPNHVSSFEEDLCMLFDSYGFEYFLTKSNENILNSSDILKSEVFKFRDMINAYKEKETNAEILEDPEWHKVVDQAKKVIELWDDVLLKANK